MTAIRTGFDPIVGDGLGTALLLKMIEDSCTRGDRLIDFGTGEREHKRRVRTRTEATYRLTYTPLESWRSQAVRLTRWAKETQPQARGKPRASSISWKGVSWDLGTNWFSGWQGVRGGRRRRRRGEGCCRAVRGVVEVADEVGVLF